MIVFIFKNFQHGFSYKLAYGGKSSGSLYKSPSKQKQITKQDKENELPANRCGANIIKLEEETAKLDGKKSAAKRRKRRVKDKQRDKIRQKRAGGWRAPCNSTL